jgi:AAA domain
VPILIKTTGFDQYLDSSRGGSYIKALIMGEHGVGKTPSAACWPKPIIADCENGLASVAGKAIPYATIRTTDDMVAVLDYCRRDSLMAPENRKFNTLVIDTIDSYQRRIIQQRLRAEQKESMSGWQDWGWLDGKMTQLIEGILSLPMHVVVNMHVKDVDDGDEDSRMLVKKARLKGDFKDSIFQDFDLIGLMESSYVAEKGERVQVRYIRWHSEPRFPSLRDRFNKLPDRTVVDFTDQDFWRIFNAITEGLDNIPETTTVEELPTAGDNGTGPAAPDVKGGPVEEPKLPRKAAAKKTPAKKATTKKAVSPPVKKEDPWEPTKEVIDLPADDPMSADDDDQLDEAVALVKDKLGATPVDDETPVAPPPEKPQTTKAKNCGDQPTSMTRFPAAPGCGQALSADNAGRAQIAVIKAKTYLCDDCFDKYLAS